MLISVRQNATKIRYNNLCISFGTCKVQRLNHTLSKFIPKSKFPAKLGGKNG